MKSDTHKCTSSFIRECPSFDASHLLGAPFPVTLHGGVAEKICPECGAKLGHVLREPDELIAMVAVFRACHQNKLSGAEVKFLRKCLNLKAKHLAEKLAIDPAHLSRIENDKQPISEVYEKLLRAGTCLHFIDAARSLGIDVSGILSMNIPAARCATKTVHLDLKLIEKKSNLTEINGGQVRDFVVSASWRDDPETKLAI